MKQIQLSQLDPARLLTYVLSRLVDAHCVENAPRKNGPEKTGAEPTQLPRSPMSAAGKILETAERHWPARFY